MAILNGVASASIQPCRFVKLSGANRVAQAGANEEIIGVAVEATRVFPQEGVSGAPAANANEPVTVYSAGEMCLVEAGDDITAGNLLKADANGKAVPIATTGTTIQNYGAVALEGGASGERIRCLVLPLHKVRPALT